MKSLRAAVLAALLLSIFSLPALAQKRLITEKDLFQFTWIADPQISPDGSQVAFVRVVVNDKKDNYDTAIWTVSTRDGEMRSLTHGPRDSSPRWSPDGKQLAFTRVVEKDGKPQPGEIYVLPLAGGEAWQLTKQPHGASQPQWSPDGKWIAFSSSANPEDLAKAAKEAEDAKKKDNSAEAKKDTPKRDEHDSDVKVITRAVYRMNGQGYLDFKHPSHLWVIAVPSNPADNPQPKQLTRGAYDEFGAMWSRDGSKLYYLSNPVPEPYYELPQDTLFSVDVAGGEPVKIFTYKGNMGAASISRDGSKIAFRGTPSEPVHSYTKPDLFVADLTAGATPTNLTSGYDYDFMSGVGGDNAAPRGGGRESVLWSEDGKALIAVTAHDGRANLESLDIATKKVTPLTMGDHAVMDFEASEDGKHMVTLMSHPTNICDLFLWESPGHMRRLTNINEKLFSQLNLTEPEEIWYTSFDGKKIQAWVQKPPDFDASKKYPLILDIHGGPHSAYGWVFDHEFQWMAAKGYVVLYPNPRGSTSYGQDFGNIIQYHYPGDDFKDLMAGVDELIKRGYVDPQRLGVTGGSGGGLLTNWVVGHTDRFKAAVAQRDISDWSGFWYDADFTLFQQTWFRGAPWQEQKDFEARSPITYIDKIKTPMMFILGEADYRTPPATGGEQLFRALKYLHREAVMVRFPGESHELSRSGQPWHRIERLEHIVNWMDIHVEGKKIAGYEIIPPEATGVAAGAN